MSRGSLGVRWPFLAGDRVLMETTYDPDADPVTSAFIEPVVETSDAGAFALPPLNGRIDPDYVDALVAGESAGSPDEVRVAVEVSLDGVAVLLCDDGRVEVYPDDRKPNRLDSLATVEHDWRRSEGLVWSIGRAIAITSDKRPTEIGERLIEHFDTAALDRLLRPRSNGAERSNSRLLLSVDGYEVTVDPAGSIAVEPSLAVLKRSGAALLVVGSLPERGFDRAVATLFGGPEEARSPLFVLHGQDLNTASRRLSMAGIAPSTATVIEHRVHARAASAATTESTPASSTRPKVIPVSDDVRTLPEVVQKTIEDDESLASGELRLSLDSLSSMVDSSGLETAISAIEPLCGIVRTHRGVGTFLLPVDPDSETAEAFAPLFDTVVEVRANNGDVEQRWWLTGTGYRTSWFPLR